jgi:hypothetical protein
MFAVKIKWLADWLIGSPRFLRIDRINQRGAWTSFFRFLILCTPFLTLTFVGSTRLCLLWECALT